MTHILSSAHLSKHEQGLVDQQLDSNLDSPSQRLKGFSGRLGIPGSNRINRLAPIKLIPQPPALLLSKKMNSFPSGLLNWSTSFCRLLIVIVPSSLKNPYLTGSVVSITKNSWSPEYPLLCAAHLFEQVQGLRIVANQYDLVIGFGPEAVQEPTSLPKINMSRGKVGGATNRSRTTNFPPQSHLTPWFLPRSLAEAPAPQNPSGMSLSEPCRSLGRSNNSG